ADLRLGARYARELDVVLPLRRLEFAFAREVLGEELGRALVIDARRVGRGAGAGDLRLLRAEVRLHLVDLRAVDDRVDLGEHVPLLDLGVEVDPHGRDAAAYLRADVDLQERLNGAGRLDLLDDVAHRDRGGDVFRRGRRAMGRSV